MFETLKNTNEYNIIILILAKDVIKIEERRIELALYVINLKIADTIKNNKEENYEKFKQTINLLTKEKEEIYKHNDEVINKVLNIYLEEVKKK